MSLAKLAIKLAIKNPEIESYERFLFLGPHPDDIEIGAGATIAKLTSLGKHVTFLICTDGRFGDGLSKGVTGDALIKLRKEECLKSASVLGVTDVRFLGLMDGNGYSYEDLLQGIADVITDVKPDIIFAPDPTPRSESHMDHINVGTAARTLACFAPYTHLMQASFDTEGADIQAIAYYMTARPNKYVRTGGYFKKQVSALFDCHLSQYPAGSPDAASLLLYLKIRAFQYGVTHFSRSGEGFRVLTKTLMHCLPEAE